MTVFSFLNFEKSMSCNIFLCYIQNAISDITHVEILAILHIKQTCYHLTSWELQVNVPFVNKPAS